MAITRILPILVAAAFIAPTGAAAQGKLNVIATTEDLAAIARDVGGDRITIEALARGYQDPHFVEAKPSFILRLQRADLLIVVGRELEVAWLPPLVQQSRNAKVQVGADGYLDASMHARILDIPQGQITRAMGDVHPSGNPHYWLDPENGKIVARDLAAKFAALRPADRPYFDQRLADFNRRVDEGMKRWLAAMAPFKGLKVVTYHRSYPNFVDRFGLDVIGYVEPRPGIPPSPSHTLALINEMNRQQIKVILMEPYFDQKTPDSIARQTGAKVVVLPPSVGGEKSITDYVGLFDHNVNLLVTALNAVGARAGGGR